jgi:uncharacterized RDD family membrane protein YckC
MNEKKVNLNTKPSEKYLSTAMEFQNFEESETAAKTKKKLTLSLDEQTFKPAKTRTELYNELIKDEKISTDEDYFEFAAPTSRVIALFIDVIAAFFIVKVAMIPPAFEVKLIHLFFLDKYNLNFMFGDVALFKLILILNIFFALIFFIVIPVAFFNVSLGKKITKLRVRGDAKYTISITQAFKRELIYKPISIVFLAGFILPFFDKKKKSLHDKMAGTFVIRE